MFINECKGPNISSWYKHILVHGQKVKFKLDSGSDTSILPLKMYEKIVNKPDLNKCSITLVSYGNFKFKPLGEVTLSCSYKNMIYNVKFIIVNFNSEPLLGLKDCLKFNLIKRVDNIIKLKTKEELFEKFKDLFEGLGEIPGFCNIELEKDAKPVIQCPRKIPFSIHNNLKNTLDKLEKQNIIEKVTYPTDWVNSLMIVEKPDKSLGLCIDPKPLNTYIKREHFMIPTSTDIISKLTGKSIFTVIDMKDGFWQLKLNKESSDVCVFNTPFGRYKFNRLPFGISSAPKLFQRKSYEIFGQINGVNIYFDDIILASDNETEHDITLKKVFETAQANKIKLNYKKITAQAP